jgi:hypothetical protein
MIYSESVYKQSIFWTVRFGLKSAVWIAVAVTVIYRNKNTIEVVEISTN